MKDLITEYLTLIVGVIMIIIACIIIYNAAEKIVPISIFLLTLIGTILVIFKLIK